VCSGRGRPGGFRDWLLFPMTEYELAEMAVVVERGDLRIEGGRQPWIPGPLEGSGRNRLTDFEQELAVEAACIGEWSLWRYLGILPRTVSGAKRM